MFHFGPARASDDSLLLLLLFLLRGSRRRSSSSNDDNNDLADVLSFVTWSHELIQVATSEVSTLSTFARQLKLGQFLFMKEPKAKRFRSLISSWVEEANIEAVMNTLLLSSTWSSRILLSFPLSWVQQHEQR